MPVITMTAKGSQKFRNDYEGKAFQVPFGSKNWETDCVGMLREQGLVVITGVYSPTECDNLVGQVGSSFEALCPDLDLAKAGKTWTKEALPAQTRSGLFQGLVANLPVTWKVRSDSRVREIFTTVYSALRGEPVSDFCVGLDGLNFRPPVDFSTVETRDWAHLDQTSCDDKYRCVQGQVVLTSTTACFRASPKSHHAFKKILQLTGRRGSKGDWCMFSEAQLPQVKAAVAEVGGEWQVPIESPRGSMILWLSATVHAARAQILGLDPPADMSYPSQEESKTVPSGDGDTSATSGAGLGAGAGAAQTIPASPWYNWRCVIYCCYRPQSDMSSTELRTHLARLQQCVRDNRTTNHWGVKIFPKSRRGKSVTRHERLAAVMADPTLMYGVKHGKGFLKPEMGPEVLALLGNPSPATLWDAPKAKPAAKKSKRRKQSRLQGKFTQR